MKILEEIETISGNTVKLFETECLTGDKTVLLIGVFHGDEPQGEFLLNKFMNEKKTPCKNRTLIIPCLNPDGRDKNTRQNANGVDINRNFPTKNRKITEDKHYFGGEEAASEIETKFLINIIEKYQPDFILSLHAPYKVVNYDGDAGNYAEDISKITGYPVEEYIGYETPGSFGTYAGIERNIPIITLELPEDEENYTLWHTMEKVFEYCTEKI